MSPSSSSSAPTLHQPATLEQAKQLGLLESEYDTICETLGRQPNFTEVSAYAVMWSEHCSYKNSITQLKTLPRDGGRLLVSAGEENAGLVDVGHGLGVAFKIESHNHPSAIEPFQGAATGVGGINRDIFTMGARPIAQLNSLRFGDPALPKTRWMIDGIVKGIAHYGNAFGIPVVAGEMLFDPCFSTNPLVNAMSVGVVNVAEPGHTVSATAGNTPGAPVYIVGSFTGKDGIHGATFASDDLTEDSAKDLPAVQVGDPFQEKLLLEASLEVIATGALIGMQDMGAAGIICSTSEMSAKSGAGMDIQLELVPTRQAGMEPYQLLLSESQERMLMVVQPGKEAVVEAVFEKWDLPCTLIGHTNETGSLHFTWHGETAAQIPAESLVLGGGAPVYVREQSRPAYLDECEAWSAESLPQPAENELPAIAMQLSARPNLASKRVLTDQYDRMVGAINMSQERPMAAGVVDLRGTPSALAMSVDCNSRYVYANPRRGAAIAVAECARNLACTGAVSLGVTNCLNFGNPYDPEVYYTFAEAIAGMGEACRAFEAPVTGGNVSFYNQSPDGPVFPSPVIGMVGLIEDKTKVMESAFRNNDNESGDVIVLLGPISDELGQSEYVYGIHGLRYTPAPALDLALEIRLHNAVREAIKQGLIASANDCSDGGLWQCLLESAIPKGLGFSLDLSAPIAEGKRLDGLLFGEAQSRIVVSCSPAQIPALETLAARFQVPTMTLGHVQSDGSITVNGTAWPNASEFANAWGAGLNEVLGG